MVLYSVNEAEFSLESCMGWVVPDSNSKICLKSTGNSTWNDKNNYIDLKSAQKRPKEKKNQPEIFQVKSNLKPKTISSVI